jgi:hypothetical protein
MTRFLIKEKERSIAKPSNLNGNSSSQTIGYKMIANKASGQQIIISISQSKKVAMVFFSHSFKWNAMQGNA